MNKTRNKIRNRTNSSRCLHFQCTGSLFSFIDFTDNVSNHVALHFSSHTWWRKRSKKCIPELWVVYISTHVSQNLLAIKGTLRCAPNRSQVFEAFPLEVLSTESKINERVIYRWYCIWLLDEKCTFIRAITLFNQTALFPPHHCQWQLSLLLSHKHWINRIYCEIYYSEICYFIF